MGIQVNVSYIEGTWFFPDLHVVYTYTQIVVVSYNIIAEVRLATRAQAICLCLLPSLSQSTVVLCI